MKAIRRAARGEALYTQEQLERPRRWRGEVDGRWKRLTEREREVLRLVVEGKTDRQIGQCLRISTATVRGHVRSILDKLKCANRTSAAVRAIGDGILPPPEVDE